MNHPTANCSMNGGLHRVCLRCHFWGLIWGVHPYSHIASDYPAGSVLWYPIGTGCNYPWYSYDHVDNCKTYSWCVSQGTPHGDGGSFSKVPPSAQNMRPEVHLWASNQELHRPTRSRRIKGWSILPLFLSLLRWGLELLLFLFLIIAKSSDSLFLLWVLNLFDVHIPLFHCRQSIQHGWGSSEEGDSHLRTVNITGECRHHDVWVVVFHLETLRVEPLKLRLEGLAFPLYGPN